MVEIGGDSPHVGRRLVLINDDEPESRPPREVVILREGLTIGRSPAVWASVDPPLHARLDRILLASRTRGAPIADQLDLCEHVGRRVYVCSYKVQGVPVPDQLTRDDVTIELWGLIRWAPPDWGPDTVVADVRRFMGV